jgi:hypothetical protein
VVEGARLERVWAGNRLVGSNPTLSVPAWLCIRRCEGFAGSGYVSGYAADRKARNREGPASARQPLRGWTSA